MQADRISLDSDAASALADRWDQYADELERYLAGTQPDLEQLRASLGPIYEQFIQAKATESVERGQAYQRVIAWARSHAQKLRRHRNVFDTADADVARGINAAGQF